MVDAESVVEADPVEADPVDINPVAIAGTTVKPAA